MSNGHYRYGLEHNDTRLWVSVDKDTDPYIIPEILELISLDEDFSQLLEIRITRTETVTWTEEDEDAWMTESN